MMDFVTARSKMVDSQLRTTDVTSHSVQKAFLTVPRENFIPQSLQAIAYVDEDLQVAPAKDGFPARYTMSCAPLAKLIQLAAVTKDDVVLEVGGASGYVSAILSQLASSVVSLEVCPDLSAQATETLNTLGYNNVVVVNGPLNEGYSSEAPYDLIFVSGAVDEVPAVLLNQLRDGGRLVTVIGFGNSAKAVLMRRDGNSFSSVYSFNASLKALPGLVKSPEFVF